MTVTSNRPASSSMRLRAALLTAQLWYWLLWPVRIITLTRDCETRGSALAIRAMIGKRSVKRVSVEEGLLMEATCYL